MAHDAHVSSNPFALSQLATDLAETTGVEAIAASPLESVYLFGKLPGTTGLVRAGKLGAAENLFENWMHAALACARGALPARAVRFAVAPDATPMIGLWVPSSDREGDAFPLVLLRRLPRAAGELPWTMLLGMYGGYLDQVERCLLPGAHDRLDKLYTAASSIDLPEPATFAGALNEAGMALARERVRRFAARNAGVPKPYEPTEVAVDWMTRVLVGVRRLCEHPAPYPTLELRAESDFDLYIWLELLRAQLEPTDRPRAVFWCRADRRALIDLDDPSPATLIHLNRPRDSRARDAALNGHDPVIDLRSVRQRGVERGEFGPGLVASGGEAGVTPGDIRRELDARARSLIDRNAALHELVGALAVSH